MRLPCDYVFALKENQPTLYEEVAKTYESGIADDFKSIKHEVFKTQNKSHGRIETRRHILITDPHYLDYFNREEHGGSWGPLAS